MSEKGLALELIDDKKVNLQSHCYLHMHSSGNIRLQAPCITVETPTELHVSRTSLSALEEKRRASGSRNPATGGGNVDSIFTMGYQFDLLSDQGVLCGTEHIKYEDCDDALTEVESKFSVGKLWGSIIAGLAVVAVVALAAAYAASVVFSGGAMAVAGPFIVGGIASIAGIAAVYAKAQSDIENQENSSIWEYIGAGFLGATVGAVAAFAIVMSPYTAEWLTQQAILMFPGAMMYKGVSTLISGSSLLATGGISLANLIFTQYNVVEAVSGKNSLKDWMMACDKANGERNYNILSGASFIGAMGIMFVGAGYLNAMSQVTGSDMGFAFARVRKPLQWHHFFSYINKTYTPQFRQILQKYGLSLSDKWNIGLLPHLGAHAKEYHEYMLRRLKEIDAIAQGDLNIFMQLIKELQRFVSLHPEMLYKDYWR